MTHNQVAYWDSVRRNEVAKESNRISQFEADTNRFAKEREEYWTHKNYNWNESMFGYQLFKDFSSMIGGAIMGGIL